MSLDFNPILDKTHSAEGVCINGAEQRSPRADRIYHQLRQLAKPFPKLVESGSTIDLTGLFTAGDMPVLQRNDNFLAWRKMRQLTHDTNIENGHCTLPWMVKKSISANRKRGEVLYQSQRTIPDCSSAGTTHALHSAILMNIGLGYPLIYDPFNFLYPFGRLKRGNLRGGAAVSDIGQQYNRYGAYPIRLVGNDVVRYDAQVAEQYRDEALKYQAAIMFLEFKATALVDEIFENCHADLTIGFANSTAVSNATTDKTTQIKIAVVKGSWAHMTAFACYRKVKGIEYIGFINSHGEIYGVSDEGEPADMCWMNRESVTKMVATSTYYGAPFLVIPEAEWLAQPTIKPVEHFVFPANWKS